MNKNLLVFISTLVLASLSHAQQYGIFSRDSIGWSNMSVKIIADGTLKGALGQTTSESDAPIAGSLGLLLTDKTFRFTGLYKVGSSIDTIFGSTPKEYLTALLTPETVGNSSVKLDLQLLNIWSTSHNEMKRINWGAIHTAFYVTSAQFSNADKTQSEEGTIVKGLLTWNPQLMLYNEHENDGNKIYLDAEVGLGYYSVGGDFIQPSNATFRNGLFGGDSYKFWSLHMGVSARLNNLKLGFEFPYVQALHGGNELHGMTGLRFIASASVDASLEVLPF